MSPRPNFYHFEDAGIFLELKNIGKVSRDAASTWSGHVFDFGLVFGIGEEEDVRVRKWVRESVRKWEEGGRSGIDRWSILVGEELRTNKVRRSGAGFYTSFLTNVTADWNSDCLEEKTSTRFKFYFNDHVARALFFCLFYPFRYSLLFVSSFVVVKSWKKNSKEFCFSALLFCLRYIKVLIVHVNILISILTFLNMPFSFEKLNPVQL